MNSLHTKARTRGFSLIEVMVALVVICVGLLGVAKLQALSLASTTIARQRSLAAIEAASLAAAMRANRLYWGSTASNFVLTWDPTVAPVFKVTPDAALQAAANSTSLTACNGVSGVSPACSFTTNPVSMAAVDLASWANTLSAILPNPKSTVSCGIPVGTTLPPSCTILITWGEKSVAMTTNEAAVEAAAPGGSKFEKPAYQLYVEP